jgi:hypothetical protein
MIFCDNCKHKGKIKLPFTNRNMEWDGDFFHPAKDIWVTQYVDLECCTLNQITGKDDKYDIEFKGNVNFNCGGFCEN